MKILWIGPWDAHSLCSQVRGSMAHALHLVDNDLSTVVYGDKGSWKTGGYQEIYYFPKPKTLLVKLFNQIRILRLCFGYTGSVIVLGERVSHLGAILNIVRVLFKKQYKIIVDIRTLPIPSNIDLETNTIKNKLFFLKVYLGIKNSDGWMAITERLRKVIESKFQISNLPCAVWESAVDERFIENKGLKKRKDILSYRHEVNILYLGSLSKGRRIDLAIRAMVKLKSEGNKFGLHIVGSGAHLSELKILVKDLSLESNVHIWDPVPYSEVCSTISSCDLGILPLPNCDAWNTSSALKLFEYMANGKPVLVSDIPAHRDLLEGKNFAFFMNEYTEQGFCNAVQEFSLLKKADMESIGISARQFVKQNHTYQSRAKVINEFLKTIVKG